jgi:hypothetical protein
MRLSLLSLGAAVGLLAACSGQEVSSSPPAVSYKVNGSDVSQANANASQYCARYGTTTAYLQSIQNGVATYTCGSAGRNSTSAVPSTPSNTAAPPSAEPANLGATAVPGAAPVECADALHQIRPGGTDYVGPPVLGCPQR